MHRNSSDKGFVSRAREFAALVALPLVIGFAALPAQAAPFAYVGNETDGTVSVIDIPTNTVVATVTVGRGVRAIAVAPDGNHAYVIGGAVAVIDTAANKVVATVPIRRLGVAIAVSPDGQRVYAAHDQDFFNIEIIDTTTNTIVGELPIGDPGAIALSPDGSLAYVTSFLGRSVTVIDTSSMKVMNTVQLGLFRTLASEGIAITPDGSHAYVSTIGLGPGASDAVLVIDTSTNTVVANIPTGSASPGGLAITPDGSRAYVTVGNNATGGAVLAIDTSSNTVAATIPTGPAFLAGIAITPDGSHVYVTRVNVTSPSDNAVLVIDTASNTVAGSPITVGSAPSAIAIVPPPPGIPFLDFKAKLAIALDSDPNEDSFNLRSHFTLSSANGNAIDPVSDPVTLRVGTFTITIPPGSFTVDDDGNFVFQGTVTGGVYLDALIKPTGTLRYAFTVEADQASLTGTQNSVYVTLTIGNNSGVTSVNANFAS